ncbi:MAG: tol-pal system-associated acyl-CoA thioesterase [Gammaproteobacteria bacterium]
MSEFVWPIRVYYEDTDAGGVVYYANYLKFMERARSEWLRGAGFEQDELARREGVIFVVRSAALDFLKPGRFNQQLNVSVKIVRHSRTTLSFEQKIMSSEDNVILCTGQIKIACVNALSWNPTPLPAHLLAEILCASHH